ncbi:MAG: beta-ribofuranosylaminobenzene 5'-phosphate synthase [Burkholderiales bacterium]|nr:beta-ribofuranosylaminobenzene 5'-phosphate synthase [Burkholderiales bacterium]MDE1928156.1 beta-ribofuranosylaminobenzene 5'-phosphate synthase [Burkholderiales bacterium]MDE2158622.1 beta-ribofuranosylaminobenzene 5'-phosphate synthase [Burkholderiales bacterium]MDE2505548.1 beta-ribofuranosylaminobenzene 5'-phosphate synthase [Burkholderiales bacterium]
MSTLSPPRSRVETGLRVAVQAPGRLHLGFLDPAATLGRRFGSLGVVIDGFETELEIAAAPGADDGYASDGAAGAAEFDRLAGWLHQLRLRTGRPQPLALRLRRALPAHAGLGSGTQLALALGRAFVRWHGLEADTPTIAAWLGRGLRSGIGIAGFDAGGLLVDGGPGAGAAGARPAPVLARIEPPADWRVIVALDPRRRGLAGAEERAAIATLPPLPRSAAADLCHQVLMRVLPGAAGDDFAAFAAGLNRIQELLGAHFAPAQGGSAWTSPAVGRLMNWLGAGAGSGVGIGQSSWGPTGFAFVPSATVARHLLDAAAQAGALDPALEVRIVTLRNRGATIGAAG